MKSFIKPDWQVPQKVKAFTTTRAGGVSKAPFDSLNLGNHVADSSSAVSKNRQILLQQMSGCNEIRWLQQVHNTDCLTADKITNEATVDAVYTRQAGLACCVMTADCLPVLFCNRKGTQVAAAHAGWKGLANGVLLNTLNTFSAEDIKEGVVAWLGPAISQAHFEVGPDVRNAFDWAPDIYFKAGQGDRLYADLYGLARLQLQQAGVVEVSGGGFCTYEEERFFSYRQASNTGRMATCIWIDNRG